MAKDRKKEKKKEKKERKRREAEELAVREKKISKKHKSKSKAATTEKPEKKPKKKSKKLQVVEEKPHKKKSKKHKKPAESESESEPESESDPETVTVPSVDPRPVKLPITTTNTNTNESDSDFDFDKEDLKNLLETYTKEDLVSLILKTAEKGSRLVTSVLESAELDSSKRNIFVRGLGWDTTHETLKAAFEVYGEIEECSVVMDKDTGRAKGYGFVIFKTRKGCREALRNPEKRMFNRTVSCNLAADKPAGAGKQQQQAREPVESVKIDLTQGEMVLPMYGGGQNNMPFYGHGHAPGFNPMYAAAAAAAFMGNQMGPGVVPNFPMFGPGMMNHGPTNHMGMAGQYGGEGNGVVGPGFDGERAWYLG